MKKIVLIILVVLITSILYNLTQWYETENIIIEKSNKKYRKDIRKLKEVALINKWLQTSVQQHLNTSPRSVKEANIKLIEFFDRYAQAYDFQVHKYIYKGEFSYLLEVEYKLSRENQKKLLKFIRLEYPDGFIFFKEFHLHAQILEGTLVIVQPFRQYSQKKNNASE